MIEPLERGEAFLESQAKAQAQSEFVKKVQQDATRRDWLKDIWNKWPGDESIKDIMQLFGRK